MLLRDYLHHNRITYEEFGKNINYGAKYICGIANGSRRPGRKVIELIVQATQGQVTAEEILNPLRRKKSNS